MFPKSAENESIIAVLMKSMRSSSGVLATLLVVRCFGAVFNILHDCDEVFNYWEPLHRLLYGFGKQPWEYSPQYALRSYLYILLHWIIIFPFSWIFGKEENKMFMFYTLRMAFAIVAAILESRLHK